MTDPLGQLTPSGGTTTTKRERAIYDRSSIGPWRGRVRVIPLTGLASRWGTTQFEVLVEWTGPGLPGLPPVDRPVEASDVYTVENSELALTIAMRAEDALLRGDPIETPDLRAIAQRLAGRRT